MLPFNTEKMLFTVPPEDHCREKLEPLLKERGCPKVDAQDLARCDMAEAVEDAFRYGRAVFAASTYDAGLFTPAYNFLHTLQTKGWCRRRVALVENGSWGPMAAKVMRNKLSACKDLTICENTVSILSSMNEENKAQIEALAEEILA